MHLHSNGFWTQSGKQNWTGNRTISKTLQKHQIKRKSFHLIQADIDLPLQMWLKYSVIFMGTLKKQYAVSVLR